MKRLVLAFALALPVCATTVPAPAAAAPAVAPADRYFGRLKMSILGIRNALGDLSARADVRRDEAGHVYDKAVLVEDALRDWQRHFPRDPWIPKFTYALAQLYAKLDLDDARTRSGDTFAWLAATYPESEFAQVPR